MQNESPAWQARKAKKSKRVRQTIVLMIGIIMIILIFKCEDKHPYINDQDSILNTYIFTIKY